MKTKKNWIMTLIFLAFVLACVQVTQVAGKSEQKANTTPQSKYTEQRDILAGLQGVNVLVEDFRPEAEKHGFNRQQYKTDVELRLRQYGIKVLSQKESSKVSGSPYLYINVTPLFGENTPMAAVNILVQLQEAVLLERNRTILRVATTWHKGMTLLCGLKRLDETREHVRDLVDMFINDYLAANPKDQPSKTIQQTYIVPKNALLDMLACAEMNRLASDPNLPQEQKVIARKTGLELLVTQKFYLYENLGLGDEDLATRMRVLLKGMKDKKLGVFDYINFEDDKKMFP